MRSSRLVLIVLIATSTQALPQLAGPGPGGRQVCGGIAGIPCDDPQQFCLLPEGQCCCDFEGVCTDIPQGCPDVHDPVCGCDGQTYGNECEAYAAGVSIEHHGPCAQVCGGFAGIPCDDPQQFCKLPDGQCCCDFEGVCTDVPPGCPDVCEPVCGCDGTTYSNECDSEMARVSVAHDGPCYEGGRLIARVKFDSPEKMSWLPHPEAQAYNVYRKILLAPPPTDAGECYLSGIVEPQAPVTDSPGSGVAWLFQVTGVFPGGEGPMGLTWNCTPRQPTEWCDTMQELCESTGGVWDENSCGHYHCGMFPPCDAIIPGCNCGPLSNFVPGTGCVNDPICGR